jgi:hypothetical protein
MIEMFTLGSTGKTASLYKYIFSMIPNTFVKALTELAFVPGLVNSPAFMWLKDKQEVHIKNQGKHWIGRGAGEPLQERNKDLVK